MGVNPPSGNTVESIPWGSYLTADAATELARLSLNNNMTADDIDFFANLPAIGGLDQSRYYFHDSTAGYMVPMRNRMRLSTGEGGGFEVNRGSAPLTSIFCEIGTKY